MKQYTLFKYNKARHWVKFSTLWHYALIAFSVPSFANNLPCDNPGILDLIDRGSFTDTPCVVPFKQTLNQAGIQVFSLTNNISELNYPVPEITIGLPLKSELVVQMPSYRQINTQPEVYGIGGPAVGLQHEVIKGSNWIMSVNGMLSLPGGNYNFGTRPLGGAFNIIGSLNITDNLQLSAMLGGATQVESPVSNNQRFNYLNFSINPSYNIQENLEVFIEVFAITQTGANQGGIAIFDCGVYYVFNKNFVLDLEGGQRLNNASSNVENYVSTGFTILMDF